MQHNPSSEANTYIVKKLPAFKGTECSLPCSQHPATWPNLTQINPVHAPHSISFRRIVILLSHLHLGLQSGLFPSSFHAYISLDHIHAKCPVYHNNTLHHIHLKINKNKTRNGLTSRKIFLNSEHKSNYRKVTKTSRPKNNILQNIHFHQKY